MKNHKKKKNRMIQNTLPLFLVKVVVWSILVPAFFLIVYTVINFMDFQWLYDYSPTFYYRIANIFSQMISSQFYLLLIFLVWLAGFIVLLRQLIDQVFSYVNAISEASEKLIDRDADYIELPPELEDIQNRMNHLKWESEKNERLARESEQKKNDLIVYLAHDLKTPLTSMIGYLSLLDEIRDMPKEQQEKYIGIALDKSYRLEELINELFDIARFNSETLILEKEEINLNLMLEQIIDDFYPVLKESQKEISLNTNTQISINGDPDKLARVFANLIKNALAYSTDPEIDIDVQMNLDVVHVIIRNKGKEIPAEKLKRLFEKFYRADTARTSKTGGSGLGLAIAKEIVELHGGSISAISEKGITEFLVDLPVRSAGNGAAL